MRYRYTRFTGEDLEGIDLEELVSKLSDLLLSSGFDTPHGNPFADDDEDDRTLQALHDAILDAAAQRGHAVERSLVQAARRPSRR